MIFSEAEDGASGLEDNGLFILEMSEGSIRV